MISFDQIRVNRKHFLVNRDGARIQIFLGKEVSDLKIFFDRLTEHLNPKALVCIYGPFNYNGAYTSDSNARFDQWLKSQNTLSGIRDFEDILFLATARGLRLMSDIAMPANNRLLVLKKD